MPEIVNFGRNLRFRPAKFHQPRSESELLEILRENAGGKIRVVASRHAWSSAIVSPDVVVDMCHFDSVEINDSENGPSVRVGAGCTIKRLLAELNDRGLTLPSVGLITAQTVAGATATGTHGSGRHSLSHYLASVRIACFHATGSEPTIIEVDDGDELRAARCSLGCMGVVVSVELPCRPQYNVLEQAKPCRTIDEALSSESEFPLQQVFLFPYRWHYYVQARTIVDRPRSLSAPLYRVYWFLTLDVGMHLCIKFAASWLQSRRLVRLLYRMLLPLAVIPSWKVVDRSDRMLVMKHDLFRHLELEAFVPKERIVEAMELVETILKQSDGSLAKGIPDAIAEQFEQAGLMEDFSSLRGRFTHHYPVCIRRVLRDETMISMASGDAECWYAISFITYVEPRDEFYAMADFLGRAIVALLDGRIHWGKWFPLGPGDVERMYPEIDRFRTICRRFDPHGVFQNEFTSEILSLRRASSGD